MSASAARAPDAAVAAERPPASWLDRLQASFEAWTLPWWSPYLGFLLLVQVAGHLARWADGSLAPGLIDPTRNPMYGAFYPAMLLWAIHWLDREADRCLAVFAPAAGLTDGERRAIADRLTTLPARPVAWLTLVAVAPATLVYLATSGVLRDTDSSLPVVGVSVVLVGVAFTSLVLFVYHTLHQLGVVVALHDAARRIDPFEAGRLYAFSALAARTGLAIIAVAWYGLFVRPDLVTDAGPLALGVAAGVLAAGALAAVVPLVGMHRALARNRDALLSRADARVSELVERSMGGDAASAGRLKDELDLAVAVRELVAAVPTWPWRPGSVAAFASTVVLPLLLWAVTQLGDRLLFGGP